MVAVVKRPKYVRHLLREDLALDSVAFLYRRDGESPVYVISDVNNAPRERPEAVTSLIREGNRDFQLRLGIRGAFHFETPSYYVTDPNEWREWGWIIFPGSEIPKLKQLLSRFITGSTKLEELI